MGVWGGVEVRSGGRGELGPGWRIQGELQPGQGGIRARSGDTGGIRASSDAQGEVRTSFGLWRSQDQVEEFVGRDWQFVGELGARSEEVQGELQPG